MHMSHKPAQTLFLFLLVVGLLAAVLPNVIPTLVKQARRGFGVSYLADTNVSKVRPSPISSARHDNWKLSKRGTISFRYPPTWSIEDTEGSDFLTLRTPDWLPWPTINDDGTERPPHGATINFYAADCCPYPPEQAFGTNSSKHVIWLDEIALLQVFDYASVLTTSRSGSKYQLYLQTFSHEDLNLYQQTFFDIAGSMQVY